MSAASQRNWIARLCRCLIVAALVVVPCGGTLLVAQSNNNDLPISIQRIVIPPERVAKELDKVQKGALLLIPLPDFDARVERARKAVQTRAKKPRLARTHYTAELVDRFLTRGSGLWSISHSGTSLAGLSIAPLNLALHQLKWEQGGDALLADFDATSLGPELLVSAKDPNCLIDWSAAGTVTNDGIHFNLATPSCPVTSFELKLPANTWLTVLKESALVTGPHDADSPAYRQWRLHSSGLKPVEFLVRKISDPKPAPGGPTIFAHVHSEQNVLIDRVEIEHDFQIDVLQGSIRELVIEGDVALQPRNVALKSGEIRSWQWRELPVKKDAKGKPLAPALGQLVIQFRQPVQGKLLGLHVSSLAPFRYAEPGGVWTSPGLRVVGAISRGETLTVKLPSGLPLGKWDHGAFQLTRISTDANGVQILSLAESAGVGSRRPTMTAPQSGIDVLVTERHHWHVMPHGATLHADLEFAPHRGNLLALRIKLPTQKETYQIESVELQPPELLTDWQMSGGFLVMELSQPLLAPMKATVRLQLRAAIANLTSSPRQLAYPELDPIDGTRRQGNAEIHVDPIFQSQLLNSSIPMAPPAENSKANSLSAYRFQFSDQRLSAALRLSPLPAQNYWRGSHTFRLEEEKANLQFQWEIEPLIGAPEHVDLRLAPGFPSSWKVGAGEGAKISHWERLPLNEGLPQLLQLGGQTYLQSAALVSMLPQGTQWRFYFNEPLRKKSRLSLEATVLPVMDQANKVWTLPIAAPVQSRNVDQDIRLETSGEAIDHFKVDGSMTSDPALPQVDKARIMISMRTNNGVSGDPGTKVTAWTRPERRSTSALQFCDLARLDTFVYRDHRTYVRLRFRLWHWHDRKCEVAAPADHQILAVRVNQRWLSNLETREESGKVVLSAPYDQNHDFVDYEIIMRPRAVSTNLVGLSAVRIPHIEFPTSPNDLKSRLFLEAGLAPLDQDSLIPVGVPKNLGGQSEMPRRLQRAWTFGQAWQPYGNQTGIVGELKGLDEQRQAVLLAERALRNTSSRGMPLAEAIERLASEHLKGSIPLVVDRMAFRSLGLSGTTELSQTLMTSQIGRPFWEALDLIYVPCPSGALLTSTGRLQSLGTVGPAQSTEIDGAVKEAILHGRDASMGFYSVLAWLPFKDDSSDNAPFNATPWSLSSQDATGSNLDMTEWEVASGGVPGNTIWIVEIWPARAGGWMIAIVIALVLWKIHRASEIQPGFRAFLIGTAIIAGIVIWLPTGARELFAWPTLLVLAAGLAIHLVKFARSRGPSAPSGHSTVSHVGAGPAAAGILLFVLSWTAPAQSPSPPGTYSVFIIDGPKPAVLVTPELFARLDELENSSQLGAQGAMVVSARYTGKTDDSNARIEAEFEIHSLKEKTNIVIPLTGIQLQDGTFLDGAPVVPMPHKNGLSFALSRKGSHHVRLSFTTRVKSVGDQRELLVGIPRVVRNQATIHWQSAAQSIQGPMAMGDQSFRSQGVTEWHAQLGYVDALHVRWTGGSTGTATKSIEVKEAHFWDLRPGATVLLSSFQYAIGKDRLAQFNVAIPEGMHVRTVDVMWTPPAAGLTVPMVLKQWGVLGKAGQRRLVIDVVEPMTGNVTVHLELVTPMLPKGSQLILPLPIPLQGKSVSGLLGYRLDAAGAPKTPNLAVQNLALDDFELLWKKQSSQAIASPTRAFRFERRGQPAGRLEIDLEPIPHRTQFETVWNLDLHQARMNGVFTVDSTQADIDLVEFFVDKGLTLADVTGNNVHRWVQQGNLLQVWLRQSTRKATLEVSAWRYPNAKTGNLPASFALPRIHPMHAKLANCTLEIQTPADVKAAIKSSPQLRPMNAERTRFSISDTSYSAVVTLNVRPAMPKAVSLTKVWGTDHGMEYWHGIQLTPHRGKLPILKVHVKNWSHGSLVLEAQGASVQPQLRPSAPAETSWTLNFSAGLPERVHVFVRGKAAKNAQANVGLPEVALEGAHVDHHWLAWRDADLQMGANGKVLAPPAAKAPTAIPLPTHLSDGWLGNSQLWSIAEGSRTPVTARYRKATTKTPASIISATEEIYREGASAWLHEALWWIQAQEATDLRIRFPGPVETFTASVDDRLHPTWNPSPQEFVLPLKGHSQPQRVRLVWKYAPGAELPESPRVSGPEVDASFTAGALAPQRILWVPRDAAPVNHEPGASPTQFLRMLYDAETALQLAVVEAKESPRSADAVKRIASLRQRYLTSLSQAEYCLANIKSLRGEFDSGRWSERLTEVKRRQSTLAKQHHFDDIWSSGDKAASPRLASALKGGQVHAGVPLMVTSETDRISVQFNSEALSSRRRTATELLLLATILLVVLSYFRHGWPIFRAVLPEVVLGLTCAAVVAFGIGLLACFLIAAMVLVRAVWILSLWRRRAPTLAAAASTGDATVSPTDHHYEPPTSS